MRQCWNFISSDVALCQCITRTPLACPMDLRLKITLWKMSVCNKIRLPPRCLVKLADNGKQNTELWTVDDHPFSDDHLNLFNNANEEWNLIRTDNSYFVNDYVSDNFVEILLVRGHWGVKFLFSWIVVLSNLEKTENQLHIE